ncbi:MAG: hypothetical protein A2Z20_01060 [Bdellovibrionales bacterium RBG_16_40_8]|nr:MAG: hypothetical protein A2Z20_01060 [Bdellovibrionales bacterium RBG_16_40_8]
MPLRKNTKRALGRGLGALLNEGTKNTEEVTFERVDTVKREMPHEKIWKIPIEKIIPNKEQPRKKFEQAKLQELAASIKEKGMLLPVLVRAEADEKYEIIAGERRWRAAQLAGVHEIPVIIKNVEKKEVLELALVENIQRQNINPIEEAEAYGVLATKYGLTQQQIAEKVSKERATIANIMRLMSLPNEIKEMVRSVDLSLGQAKALLALENPQRQLLLAKKIVRLKLSVRTIEKMIAKLNTKPEAELDIEDEADAVSIRELQPLKSEMQRMLGTKVDIDLSGQRSKVSINFYSHEELNRFVDKLRKAYL